MDPIKVFREGKGTFTEWRYENGKPFGRILNQGEGILLEEEFSSLEETKVFCGRELEKDASIIFHVMLGNDIIDTILNKAYHQAESKKENRTFAAISTAVVMLLATGVSVMFMPFQAMIYHALFIGGMGSFYLLLYSTGGNWNLENVVATIILLILLSIVVPLLTK